MSLHHTVTRQPLVSRTDLEQAGLERQQIDRLEALANSLPWIEFADSAQEWNRLLFLKWRYETGRLEC